MIGMRTIFAVVIAGMTVVSLAFASKDSRRKELEERIAKSTKKIDDICGCPGPKRIIDWNSFPTEADMGLGISELFDNLYTDVKQYCGDDHKAKYCAGVKGVSIKIHYKKGGGLEYDKARRQYDCGIDVETGCS